MDSFIKVGEESKVGAMTSGEISQAQNAHFVVDENIRMMLRDLTLDVKKEIADMISEKLNGS